MKHIIIIAMICVWTNLHSQTNEEIKVQTKEDTKEIIEKTVKQRSCFTVGILQGGGSLIGIDIEFLITKHFGFQVGLGYVGLGVGINYHFKPLIGSSFISLQYWGQGIGYQNQRIAYPFTQNVLGPNFVFRGKKWFTFQIGLGARFPKDFGYSSNTRQSPVILMYAIGAYIQ